MSSFEFFFFLGWLFASQKSGFSGLRTHFVVPSFLRFGTGYASPYNPCHGLYIKYSKLNLIAKHKDIHIEADGTTDTIQGDINGKFIRDCFIVFLNTLASNTADTYKFIKPVTGVNPFK